MNLNELKPGQTAVVSVVGGDGALRQHFLDMGVIPGAEVTLVKLAPMGDPMELRIHGYELTLRLADAARIAVTPVDTRADSPAEEKKKTRHVEHPGLGEEGKYHPKGSGDPLPEGTTLTFALVGNQNSGKTTLFNQLTGANQHVGNFPGVTVDRKDGVIRGYADTRITDLPGIYSMSPYTSEEIVSRDFVLKSHPHAIINIVDVTTIDRGLYLTMQLLEMGVPTVVALNMMDEMTGNGGAVDVNAMEAMLGVPVVPISASKNAGVDELVRHAVHIAKYQEKPLRQDFCDAKDHGGAVHRCLHAVIHLIEDHAEMAGLPVRFAAAKLIEGDQLILEQLGLDQNEKEMLEHIVLQMETERGLDRSAAMADMRFTYIYKLCDRCVTRPHESREHIRSARLDRVLTGKWSAIPVFIAIMGLVFWLTFFLIGPFFQDLLARGINTLAGWTEQAMTAGDESSAYDAESQTLTVSVMFGTDGKQPGEEITVLFNVNGLLDLGSLAVKITDPDTRLVQLSEPIVLTNPVTEKPVTLIGMELRGNQAIWMLETEDAAYFYGDHSSDSEADAKLRQDNIVTWINWLDEQFRATKLYFADGSSCSFNGHEFSDVDGNLVRPHVDYDRLAIDVSQVVSIEMNGQTYKIR